jgi:hypothetical protein
MVLKGQMLFVARQQPAQENSAIDYSEDSLTTYAKTPSATDCCAINFFPSIPSFPSAFAPIHPACPTQHTLCLPIVTTIIQSAARRSQAIDFTYLANPIIKIHAHLSIDPSSW